MVKAWLISFKSVYNFANYLAITPPYDFQRCNLIDSNLYKCYVIFVGIISIIGEAWSMWYRWKGIGTFRTSVRVVDTINEIILFLTYLVIKFDLCLLHNHTWNDLLRTLDHWNKNLLDKGDKISTEKFISKQIFVHSLFIVLNAYQWFAFFSRENITLDFAATYTIHYICVYNMIYVIIIMNTILVTFEKKYKFLNKNFERNFWISQKIVSTKFVEVIRHMEVRYRELSGVVDIFNKLFGNVILFKFTNSIVNFVVMINVILLSETFGKQNRLNTKNLGISSTLTTLFSVMWVVVFVFLCQKVIQEGKNTVKLCHSLQEQVPAKSDEREELFKLAIIAEANIPVFSAAGFFQIDKTILVSMFGTVTSYVIVLIQINMSM